MSKLVSIIIPCFNSEATIEETLGSLEGNDSKLFEVIIVDDGSNDSTLLLVSDFAKKTSLDVKIVQQPNQGVSVARNKGMDIANGKYIVFLDSDDLLARHYVDNISEILASNEYDTVACYRTNNLAKLVTIESLLDKVIKTEPISLLKKYTYNKQKLGFTSFCYKKSIVNDYKLRFTEGSKYGEDFEFVTKYLANCKTAVEINCYHYYYRLVNNSASRTVRFAQVDAIYSAQRAEKYLAEMRHPFCKEFKDYMVYRAIFSCAHRFSKGKSKELFEKLHANFNVKEAMSMLKDNKNVDVKTRAACRLYLINKYFFYYFCRF